MQDPASRRLLLVHAHPDDESIETGATMARYAAQGVQVTLVTCTLGELGEIIPPGLAHLSAEAGGGLGGYRIGELDAACAALGVTDHRFLGGAGRFRDSGMMGLPSNDEPGSFWQADPDAAAALLVRIIEEVQPQVMVTYDQHGFYGHPDHIQAHRVAWRAFSQARAVVSKFYATALPLSALAEAITVEGTSFTKVESAATLPFGIPDDEVTTAIDGRGYLDAKLAAMREHGTQISVDGQFYALSDGIGLRALGTEYYTLVSPEPPPGAPPEDDLFAGIG
ncbi:MAG TPA: N-acetyl-1-D-myo-inositol-2-amino-2-deoxy-alpha-D-glucopyranoside deacetylase [Streptosporangiaceae bacterium]